MKPSKSLDQYKVGDTFDGNPDLRVFIIEESLKGEAVSMGVCWRDRTTDGISTIAYVKGTIDFFPGPIITPSDEDYKKYITLLES